MFEMFEKWWNDSPVSPKNWGIWRMSIHLQQLPSWNPTQPSEPPQPEPDSDLRESLRPSIPWVEALALLAQKFPGNIQMARRHIDLLLDEPGLDRPREVVFFVIPFPRRQRQTGWGLYAITGNEEKAAVEWSGVAGDESLFHMVRLATILSRMSRLDVWLNKVVSDYADGTQRIDGIDYGELFGIPSEELERILTELPPGVVEAFLANTSRTDSDVEEMQIAVLSGMVTHVPELTSAGVLSKEAYAERERVRSERLAKYRAMLDAYAQTHFLADSTPDMRPFENALLDILDTLSPGEVVDEGVLFVTIIGWFSLSNAVKTAKSQSIPGILGMIDGMNMRSSTLVQFIQQMQHTAPIDIQQEVTDAMVYAAVWYEKYAAIWHQYTPIGTAVPVEGMFIRMTVDEMVKQASALLQKVSTPTADEPSDSDLNDPFIFIH